MMWMFAIVAASTALQSPPPAPPRPRIVAPAVPRGDLSKIITFDDYPVSALRNGEEGVVGFILDVGADGRVPSCIVVRPSKSDALNGTTCRIMHARMRFTPARDNSGQPAPSRMAQEVRWTLPKGSSKGSVTASKPSFITHGPGIAVSHSSPPPVIVRMPEPPIYPEPAMAIPQDGPGEAGLSVWTPGKMELPTLGRFKSFPECRKAKARLKLKSGQKAYCTVPPPKQGPRFHI
jgi:TonB family protein